MTVGYGPYNLTAKHRQGAIDGVLQAAVTGLHHSAQMGYTQGGARWEGIDRRLDAAKGEVPRWSDCSSFLTWCFFNGLVLHGGNHSDKVNGTNWQAGYTGTLLQHGIAVSHPLPGDAIIYGSRWPGEHTAVYSGGGKVVSHGSPGCHLLPIRYRPDILSIRRYI